MLIRFDNFQPGDPEADDYIRTRDELCAALIKLHLPYSEAREIAIEVWQALDEEEREKREALMGPTNRRRTGGLVPTRPRGGSGFPFGRNEGVGQNACYAGMDGGVLYVRFIRLRAFGDPPPLSRDTYRILSDTSLGTNPSGQVRADNASAGDRPRGIQWAKRKRRTTQ